jgi:hypothetical protein
MSRKHFPSRSGGVDRLFGRLQGDAALTEIVEDVLEAAQGAGKAVDPGDDQGVAFARPGKPAKGSCLPERQIESAIRRQNSTVKSRTHHEQTFMPPGSGRVLVSQCARVFPPPKGRA